MAKPNNFRSALNGFHREDVVNYIEYLTGKHRSELSRLQQENEELADRCAQLEAQIAAQEETPAPAEELELLKQEHAAELDQQEKLFGERIAELEAEIARLNSESEKTKQTELETYRRAERMEREARVRAERIRIHAGEILDSAAARIRENAAGMEDAASALNEKLDAFCRSVDASREELLSAADALKDLETEE